MKEIVYELEEFKKIAEREKADLGQAKLDFPEKSAGDGHNIFVVATPTLYLPLSGSIYRENRILMCELHTLVFNRAALEFEQRQKEEGEETKRMKKFTNWVKSQVKEKLNIEPPLGRWEE